MQSTSFPSSSSSSSSSSSPSPASSSSGSSQRVPTSASKLKHGQIPKNPSLSLKFLAYSTGATFPSTIKKVTRKASKDQHIFDWSFSGRETQLSWVLQPERHHKRGQSKNPPERETQETDATETGTRDEDIYERDTYESGSQQPMFDFPSEAPRAPKLKGRSRGMVERASGHAGGSMATPRHGDPRASGFSHSIRSIVRSSRGIPTPSSSRK